MASVSFERWEPPNGQFAMRQWRRHLCGETGLGGGRVLPSRTKLPGCCAHEVAGGAGYVIGGVGSGGRRRGGGLSDVEDERLCSDVDHLSNAGGPGKHGKQGTLGETARQRVARE